MTEIHVNIARQTILDLAGAGVALATMSRAEPNLARREMFAKRVIGYLTAANAMLEAYAELHNELVEHPDMMALRRFQRGRGF